MSLHINLTEDALREVESQKKRNFLSAILTALLGTTLLFVLLYVAVIAIVQPSPPVIDVTYIDGDHPTTLSDVPKVERTASRPPATPTNAVASIITTSAIMDTSVASLDMVDMPNADISQNAVFSENLFGPPSDTGGLLLGTDSVDGTPPGSTLEGTFYDFKQTQSYSPTNLTNAQVMEELKRFVSGKWNSAALSRYYKAPTRLYASQFYIPRRSATEAPKAYKCSDKVKDGRWCAIYRGKVRAPKSGKFRFVGVGDDALVVRFNNDNVFDYGWVQATLGKDTSGAEKNEYYKVMTGKSNNAGIKKELEAANVNVPPVQFHRYTSTGHWNNSVGGLACGKVFEVKAGEIYPIEVLISEIPGGEFGTALLIEEIGVPAATKDAKTGAPILPLFRTNYAVPDASEIKGVGGDFVPFDKVGPVWEVIR